MRILPSHNKTKFASFKTSSKFTKYCGCNTKLSPETPARGLGTCFACHFHETVSESCSVTTLSSHHILRRHVIFRFRLVGTQVGNPKLKPKKHQKTITQAASARNKSEPPAVLGCKSRVHSAAFLQDTWPAVPAPRQAVSPRARRSPRARPPDVRRRPDSKCRSEWCAASLVNLKLLKLTCCRDVYQESAAACSFMDTVSKCDQVSSTRCKKEIGNSYQIKFARLARLQRIGNQPDPPRTSPSLPN